MLLLTAYCLQMTAEMCIPHLSSDRINSNAVFHVCFDNVWMLSTTHGMLSGCQVWLKNFLKTPTVKKKLKKPHKRKTNQGKRSLPVLLAAGFHGCCCVARREWQSLGAPAAGPAPCVELHWPEQREPGPGPTSPGSGTRGSAHTWKREIHHAVCQPATHWAAQKSTKDNASNEN